MLISCRDMARLGQLYLNKGRWAGQQFVDAGRITVISYGEERPTCTEKTEACWAKNRRAHFLVKQ